MDVRTQILTEATRLFAAHGFDATSLQQIADAVGIRKPSLLYHFPSKADLRHAVLEAIAAHWNEALPRLLEAASTGHEQLDAVVQAMIAFFTEDADRARLVLRELLDRPAEMRALIGAHVHAWAAAVCTPIRKGQAQGRVQPDVDPEAYVLQVINLVVTGIATHECLGTLLLCGSDAQPASSSGAPGAIHPRHTREILRVARRGLFLAEAAPQPGDAGPDTRPSD